MQAVAATQSLDAFPAITAFVARIQQDAAWQRVVERAGPLTMPGE
jgi:glutathione S-transferase